MALGRTVAGLLRANAKDGITYVPAKNLTGHDAEEMIPLGGLTDGRRLFACYRMTDRIGEIATIRILSLDGAGPLHAVSDGGVYAGEDTEAMMMYGDEDPDMFVRDVTRRLEAGK